MEIKVIIENILLYKDLVEIILISVPLISFLISFSIFNFIKQKRFFDNLKRPIMLIKSSNIQMDVEYDLLKDSGFFNSINRPTEEIRALDRISNHSLIILGFSKGDSKRLKKGIEVARSNRIPIIVYAKPGSLTKSDLEILNSYSYQLLCNFPLRLVSDTFAIMSTFKHDNK